MRAFIFRSFCFVVLRVKTSSPNVFTIQSDRASPSECIHDSEWQCFAVWTCIIEQNRDTPSRILTKYHCRPIPTIIGPWEIKPR